MPEKKRIFESNTSALPALKLQGRPPKDGDEPLETYLLAEREGYPGARKGQRFSRELILRLIDWFKET